MYINDLVDETNSLNKGLIIGNLQVSILLYVDGVVIVADKEENLQDLLNTLADWLNRWKIYINKSKSRVAHFRKNSKPYSNHAFKVGSLGLDYAHKYKYLGVFFQ